MSVGSYEVSHRPQHLPIDGSMVWRASQLEGSRWFEPGLRYPFFQDGFTAYPVHIRIFGPASAPSSSQFIHFLDRPTGRDPQDLSAPLDGLCAYIPGSLINVSRPEPIF